MTHTPSHIIIDSLKAPVMGKLRLWHVVLLLILIAYVVGYAVGKP